MGSFLDGYSDQGDKFILSLKQPSQMIATIAAEGQPPDIARKPGKFPAGLSLPVATGGMAEEPDGKNQARRVDEGMLVAAGDGDGLVAAGDDVAAVGATQDIVLIISVFGAVLLPRRLYRREAAPFFAAAPEALSQSVRPNLWNRLHARHDDMPPSPPPAPRWCTVPAGCPRSGHGR